MISWQFSFLNYRFLVGRSSLAIEVEGYSLAVKVEGHFLTVEAKVISWLPKWKVVSWLFFFLNYRFLVGRSFHGHRSGRLFPNH